MVEPALDAYIAASMLMVAWMSGCTSGRDDAISQRFTRYDYMNGNHTRAHCG